MNARRSQSLKQIKTLHTLFPNIDEKEISEFVHTNSSLDLPHLIAHFLSKTDITGPGKDYISEISKARIIRGNLVEREKLANAVSNYKPSRFEEEFAGIVDDLIRGMRITRKRPSFTIDRDLQHIASYIACMLRDGNESFDFIKLDKYLELYKGTLENVKYALALVIKTESTSESINELISHDFKWRDVILDENNKCGLGCSISFNDAVFIVIITGK